MDENPFFGIMQHKQYLKAEIMLLARLDHYFTEVLKHVDLIGESLEVPHKELPLSGYDTLG